MMDEHGQTTQQKNEPALSPRIGTRFYRAPEVVLCDPNYDYGVDIWSIGCILAELLMNFVEAPKGNSTQTFEE